MQISGYQQQNPVKSQVNPSFGGLTHVFKNRLFSNADTYERLMASAEKQPYIGSLPKEIIEAISAVTHSKKEKTAIIKRVMASFSQAAKALKDSEELYLKTLLSPKTIKKIINHQNALARKASRILTLTFHSAGVLTKDEKIVVSRFNDNEGIYGIVYNIKFPERLKISDKIIKIFKNIKALDNWESLISEHGIAAEANAAMFIKKQQGKGYKKSLFVEPYLASLKDKFMLSENVYNYPAQECTPYTITRIFKKLNIGDADVNAKSGHNIRNGRIIDYGMVSLEHEDLTHDTYKIFSTLNSADVKSINTGSDKPVIDALIKYVKGSQKEIKVSRFDANSGVEAFLGNTAFSEATKDILVKLKLFKPEQICTY